MEYYLSCLQQAPEASAASRIAASAVVRLWTRHRSHAPLSHAVERHIVSGRRVGPLLPLAFLLTSRLGAAAGDCGATAGSAGDGLDDDPLFGGGGTQLDDEPMSGPRVGPADAEAGAASLFQTALRALLQKLAADAAREGRGEHTVVRRDRGLT